MLNDHPSQTAITYQRAMILLECSRATLYRLIVTHQLHRTAGRLLEQQVLDLERSRRHARNRTSPTGT